MLMPVMRIWVMRVAVHQGFMPVRMAVRCAGGNREVVRMLVMFVMDMRMFVHQCFMGVRMRVPFAQMQPDTQRHQPPGQQQR